MEIRGGKDYVSLAKGLITDRSPLAGEDGATSDELNFTINPQNGARVRRKGFEVVSSYASGTPAFSELRTRYFWSDVNLIVDIFQETEPVSGNLNSHVVVCSGDSPYTKLVNFALPTPDGSSYTDNVSVSSVRNFLYICSGTRVFVLEKLAGNTIKAYRVDLYIRDFKLIPDGLRIGQRVGTLNDEHRYNLYNAGWYAERKVESSGSVSLEDPIQAFSTVSSSITYTLDIASIAGSSIQLNSSSSVLDGTTLTFTDGPNSGTSFIVTETINEPGGPYELRTDTSMLDDSGIRVLNDGATSEFPSNADIPVLGLKALSTGEEVFSKDTLIETVMGNTEAPRGHYVYPILAIDRQSKINNKTDDGAPAETVVFLSTHTW